MSRKHRATIRMIRALVSCPSNWGKGKRSLLCFNYGAAHGGPSGAFRLADTPLIAKQCLQLTASLALVLELPA